MGDDFYYMPPDTGRAPRAPHPWSLIPFVRDEYQIITHVDFSDGNRQVVTGVPRVSKPHGHVFQTFYSPETRPFSVTFGALAINYGYTSEKGLFRLHTDIAEKDRLGDGGKLRMALGPMWKCVQGEVCDQEYRYSDAMLISVPKKPQQFYDVLDYIQERAANPSKYQVVGWAADNCIDFSAKNLRVAQVERPLLWKVCPWPWAVALYIKQVAAREARGEIVQVKGTKFTHAVTKEAVRQRYDALRSHAVPERQIIQLAA